MVLKAPVGGVKYGKKILKSNPISYITRCNCKTASGKKIKVKGTAKPGVADNYITMIIYV